MKEYGNKEPWTKLYSIPYMGDQVFYHYSKSHCYAISEDDQVLIDFEEFLTMKLLFMIPKMVLLICMSFNILVAVTWTQKSMLRV